MVSVKPERWFPVARTGGFIAPVYPSTGVSPDEARVEKKLDRVDTFIGRNDRGEYIKVGSTENLYSPGVIFRYASYVREQEALLGYYLQFYHENLKGLVYTEKGAYYTI